MANDQDCPLEAYSNEFVCFVKLMTDSGAVGLGTSSYNADVTATIFHRQVARWALGCDALDITAFVDLIERREHNYPGSYRCRALAGLEAHYQKSEAITSASGFARAARSAALCV